MVGIYCIINKVNQKRYIGQSVDIKRRWAQEQKMKSLNEHLLRSMQKYGLENFEFIILEECSSDLLNEREKYYINLYNTTNPNFGYNKIDGGDSAYKRVYRPMSQDQKDKISRANKGRKKSKEELKHLLEAQKYKDKSKSEKKVFCYENNKVYNSCITAANELNIPVDGIRRCLSGNITSTNNYHFCSPKDKDIFIPDLRSVNERISESQKALDRCNRVVSKEIREKLRRCQLGRVKSSEEIEKIRKANLGKKLSEEHKQKISMHSRHNPCSEEQKKKISKANKLRMLENGKCKSVYCFETNIIYDSISEAAKQNNINDDIQVSRCCNKQQKTALGKHFCFANEKDIYIIDDSIPNGTPIYCIELNKIYKSISVAVIELKSLGYKVNKHGIIRTCKNKQSMCGGLHFKYASI